MRRRVMVIMKGVGVPLSNDPVRLPIQRKAILTGKNMNRQKAIPVRRIQSAVSPEPALVRATARARRTWYVV